MRHLAPLGLCLLAAPLAAQSPREYIVSQLDAAGTSYVELGRIQAYCTEQDVASYYNFTGANPNFTDPAPTIEPNTSHLYLVESSVDGLCVGYVHDKQADGSGGRAETSWKLVGDADGMSWLVQDGVPSPGQQDTYTGGVGANDFTALQIWPAENSDGGILGDLDGNWRVEGSFTDVAGGSGNEMNGLSQWKAYSADGTDIVLDLVLDRPVRIEPAPDCTGTTTIEYVVFQWNPATGVFDELGVIAPFLTAQSASAYYNFTDGNPSFTDPAPPITSDRSHLFVLESDVDGICVGFVHDKKADVGGGMAETEWTVIDDADGGAWLVEDGPGGPGQEDVYTGSPGDFVFTAHHEWPAENSDGGMIGSLDDEWILEGAFTDVDGSSGNEMIGIADWVVYSATGSTIPLVLELDRPVRITRVGQCLPYLEIDCPVLSVSTGGTRTFFLHGGPANGGSVHLLLGSVSGAAPGLPVGASILPLNFDGYLDFTLNNPNTPPLGNSLGVLDAAGEGTATFTLPPGTSATLAGVVAHHAYVAIGLPSGAISLVSNAVALQLTP